MIFLIQFLATHGLMLLGGSTALMSAGAVALAAQRSPAHRQRLGELTLLCTLLWSICACVPLFSCAAVSTNRRASSIFFRFSTPRY